MSAAANASAKAAQAYSKALLAMTHRAAHHARMANIRRMAGLMHKGINNIRFTTAVKVVEPSKRMKEASENPLPRPWLIRPGDMVQVMKGKDAGHVGVVRRVDPKVKSVIVAGAATARVHQIMTKRYAELDSSGIILDMDGRTPIEHVQLLDPVTGEPTPVSWQRIQCGKDGKGTRLARISQLTGTEVPLPVLPRGKPMAVEGPRDTAPDEVARVTFTPSTSLLSPPIPVDCVL